MSTSFRQLLPVSHKPLARTGLHAKNSGMWHNKLSAAFRMQKVTAASLARETGWSYNTIRNYLGGITQPRYEVLLQLCRRANVPVEWVIDDAIPDLPVVLASPPQPAIPEGRIIAPIREIDPPAQPARKSPRNRPPKRRRA